MLSWPQDIVMDDKDQSRCSGPVKFWLGFGLLLLASGAVIVICVLVVVPQIKSNDGMNKTEDTNVIPRILEAIPTLEEVRAVGENLTSKGEISVWKKRLATLPSDLVDQVEPGRVDNPENVKLVETIISEEDWEYLFPKRNSGC